MGTPDKFNLINDLLVEMNVATEEELAQFLHESRHLEKPSLWAYMREIGRLTQPQADTLEMAAKGYIPVEAARVSINVQGRISTGASDLRPKTLAQEAATPRGLLKIQRPGAGTTNNRYSSVFEDRDGAPDKAPTPAPNPRKEISTGGFEALLADNIIALPTIKPTKKPAVEEPKPAPPARRPAPKADPSSVAAWKQIVDSMPRQGTPRPQTHSDTGGGERANSSTGSSPAVAPLPGWLALSRPREGSDSGGGSNHSIRPTPSRAENFAPIAAAPQNGRALSGLVGRRLGKFQLSSQIGKGSSGSVYMGHHVVLNMPVAIKVLDPGLAAFHPELLKRFKHEARSAARIAHPNIVRVIDCDHIEGYHIIVMEYVDGISVSELVKINGQVAEERALVIVQAVAEGLEAALECGIIHRDIKPANIMITKNKQVKLADLGLAKRVDDPTNISDTRPNIGLGTPHYFAPEQASNAVAADHRADIYSLGATLYNMLTGSVPFKGKTIAELIHKHHEEPLAPPHTLVPHLSRATSDLTVYMMAKRPEDRPQNYADLLNAVNASIYNLKNRQSQSDAGSKTGSTIVRDILNLFSPRK